MIELNEKTQQDFLNREWVQKLMDAGIDMSDAKYIIAKDKLSMNDDEPDLTDYVWYKDSTAEVYDVCPTYTVQELFYKLLGKVNNNIVFDVVRVHYKKVPMIEILATILCNKQKFRKRVERYEV